MLDYSKIITECFWDVDINKNDIVAILDGMVVNLKGLVRNKELLLNNKKNDLLNYIDSHNIKYIIQWFPRSLYDNKLKTFMPQKKNILLDIRVRLLYQSKDKFKLIDRLEIKDRLRGYNVFILERIKK